MRTRVHNACGVAAAFALALFVLGATPRQALADHHEMNPCAGAGAVNPCRFKQPSATRLGGGDRSALLAQGKALWKDPALSSNGAACATCHAGNAQFQASFARPYPHEVTMVKQMSGAGEVNAAEMVQFCMLQPMQAEPLRWGSSELAALATYVEEVQRGYMAANPCGLRNPCALKNPCAGGR